VCVLSDPDKRDETRLRATGRLEGGKVFSFRHKKQMTFADYVRDELGRAESACAHMFLVRTKESIDDHLKVCDAFSDKERQLGPRRATQAAANTRKPPRRSR
jgi:cyanate lyase